MTRRSTVTAGVCFVVFVFMLAARERVVTTWAVHTPVGRPLSLATSLAKAGPALSAKRSFGTLRSEGDPSTSDRVLRGDDITSPRGPRQLVLLLCAPLFLLLSGIIAWARRWSSARRSPLHPLAALRPSVVMLAVGAVAEVADPPAEVMSNLVEFLKGDLQHLFDDQGIDASKYDPNVRFEDPITQYSDLNGYIRNIQFLRLAFRPTFTLHSCKQTGPREITTRWTMTMKAWILPWQPELIFTGRTFMTVSTKTLKFDSHRDAWDSVQNNAYLSPEAVQDLLRQVFRLYTTPNLNGPKYEVLRRTAAYEVRRYESYVVAETPMGSGATVASGSGFTALADYIFGNNAKKEKMNMTTPVFTTAPSPTVAPMMQFVMEAPVDRLPAPATSAVQVAEVPGQLVAAAKFSGFPSAEEVQAAERALRGQLQADGVPAEDGYVCARYNEPTTPPFLRRNEVIIRLNPEYDPIRD